MGLDNLQSQRQKKLKNIQKLGISAYPAKANRKQTLEEAKKMLGKKVVVVGRVRSLRPHGKITFADIEDASGKIQLFFSQNETPGEKYDFLNNLDLGDFISVEGEVFKTQAGEITVKVSSYELLTKSMRPLPSSWYGLKDVEERYRKRYLDLLMNPEVRQVAEKRSQIIFAIRKFLIEEKGYFEVEDPILQPIYGGTRARPFKTHHNSLDADLYLRISNELYLKRLIVGGFEKVFEIGHTFRNEGMDRNHNPEFTMLETMEAYADYFDNMNLIEEMFEYVALQVFGKTKLSYQGTVLEFKRPWARVKLEDLFKKYTGVSMREVDTLEKATTLAKKLGVKIQDFMTDGEILLEIFEKKCTDQLIQPTFVYDYPADFYPLAKRCKDDPKFVESFDIYVSGMEMGTNYSEQNDPQALRHAWLQEKKKAQKGNLEAQKLDEDFLEALEYGMPPTSGIGPGIDRWIMMMTDSPAISDVILFPTLRPEKRKRKK
jgi:lysyl-tRNA synthetase class 2